MARPIKDTPILKGDDAKRFKDELKASEGKCVPREDYQRAMETYYRVMKNSKLDP